MANPVTPAVEADEPAPGSSEWLGAEIDRMFRRSTRWIVGAIVVFGLTLDVCLYIILTRR